MIAFHIDVPRNDPFRPLKNDLPRIEKLILGRMGEKIVSQTTKEYLRGQVLKRRSGTLANSLKYRMVNDYTIEVGPGVIYGRIHEEGGVIVPVQKKFLAWKDESGKWCFAKSVTIPKRPWLYPSIKDYFDSGRAGQLAERTLAAELDKLSRRN